MTTIHCGHIVLYACCLFFFLNNHSFAAAETLKGINPASTFSPAANPNSIVIAGHARFTVLTEHIIRMEWSSENKFQDNATFAFVNRTLPTPDFHTSKDATYTYIDTSALKLSYVTLSEFSFNATNLQVIIKDVAGQSVTWTPGINDKVGNLFGTLRTLDQQKGPMQLDCQQQDRPDLHCTYGVISRGGYTIIDDTVSPHYESLNGIPWPWVVSNNITAPPASYCSIGDSDKRDCGFIGITQDQCEIKGCCYSSSESKNGVPSCFYSTKATQDLYVFGHGHNYKLALKEFTTIAGSIPVPPRYIFGIFYSRYWQYNDIGLKEIVNDYISRKIPLSNLVVDMDWHYTFYKLAVQGVKDQAGQEIGWSGFTWNSQLFPDPDGFIQWCKNLNLRNALNIHPASGIQPWEDTYVAMAEAMGIDPNTEIYVPFDMTNQVFMNNFFNITWKGLTSSRSIVAWLDWQQGEDWLSLSGVNPTFWLNYLFFTNPLFWETINSDTEKYDRPVIMHRWGGLGNHRMQIGFSGDTFPSWEVLDYQVYFTLCATNVGYSYWSHDIGGHQTASPPELFTRWVQFGIFSPIFRTHCTKNADNDRRIWMYPPENFEIMRSAMQLREKMLPYIYSEAHNTYNSGVGILRAMYYDYPEIEEAYSFSRQYMFGDSVMVAPITSPMNSTSQLTSKDVWIPPGTWFSWVSGKAYTGPQTLHGSYLLSEIPVFSKAGSIIPMRCDDLEETGSAAVIPSCMRLDIFSSASSSGSYLLTEDDGQSANYQLNQEFITVEFAVASTDDKLTLTISPLNGTTFSTLPQSRGYEIRFLNTWPANSVQVNGVSFPSVSFNEVPKKNSYSYDGSTMTVIVHIITPISLFKSHTIVVTSSESLSDPLLQMGYSMLMSSLANAKVALDNQWGIDTVYMDDYPNLLDATETGQRITTNPSIAHAQLTDFAALMTAALAQVSNLKMNTTVQASIIAWLDRDA